MPGKNGASRGLELTRCLAPCWLRYDMMLPINGISIWWHCQDEIHKPTPKWQVESRFWPVSKGTLAACSHVLLPAEVIADQKSSSTGLQQAALGIFSRWEHQAPSQSRFLIGPCRPFKVSVVEVPQYLIRALSICIKLYIHTYAVSTEYDIAMMAFAELRNGFY